MFNWSPSNASKCSFKFFFTFKWFIMFSHTHIFQLLSQNPCLSLKDVLLLVKKLLESNYEELDQFRQAFRLSLSLTIPHSSMSIPASLSIKTRKNQFFPSFTYSMSTSSKLPMSSKMGVTSSSNECLLLYSYSTSWFYITNRCTKNLENDMF